MTVNFDDAAAQLSEVGRRLDAHGWVLGTSGNLSIVTTREPLRLAITPSGVFKGSLAAGDVLEIDASGRSLRGAGRPSAEAALHVELVQRRGAGAVLHTHSIWGTLASERHHARGGLAIEGYEMLKGLDGVSSHEHREWIPVIENDQDMARLARQLGELLAAEPACHAFLLRRHGLYTWGATLFQAVRHIEILEFLLEITGRNMEEASWRS